MVPDPIKILAVDDRADNLLAIDVALRNPDYEIVKVQSGAGALRFLLDNDCAVILMDVQMPEMDGFETARLIRASPKSADTPIIFLTAVSQDRSFVAKGYAGGAVDYLFKPLDAEILRAKVAVFVRLYRAKLQTARQAALDREREAAERRSALAQLELKSLRREQALHRRYGELVNGISHAVIWSADPHSLVPIFLSPSAQEILGVAPEIWSQSGFWERHLHPEERAWVEERLRNATDQAGVVFEHRFGRSDGSYAWLRTSARRARTVEGVLELHGLSVDLSAQKEAEESLRLISVASAELAATLDVEQALRRLFQLLIPRHVDWCLAELFDASGAEGPSKVVAHGTEESRALAVQLGDFHPAIPLEPRQEDGVAVPTVFPQTILARPPGRQLAEAQRQCLVRLQSSCVVIPLRAGGRALGVLTLGRTTDRGPLAKALISVCEELGRRVAQAVENGRLYQEVQDSVRLREDFLSVASHELRTPLTPLKLQLDAWTRTLLEADLPEALRDELLRKTNGTQRQIARMTKLVESLLDVSRIRTGKLELQIDQVELASVVREVVTRVQDELQREGLSIELELEDGVVGMWDRSRLDQIVMNLLSNAIKYGDRKPIRVRAFSVDGGVVLEVRDQGIGISGPNPERVFQRFERAADARSFGGLGLGLYIVRQLVELHGGTVEVSTQSGAGSTFTVRLPKQAAVEPSIPDGRIGAAEPST